MVIGRAYPVLKAIGAVENLGDQCGNYDKATKQCMIYETRPNVCRVDALKPPFIPTQVWYDHVENECDKMHLRVYGTKRERLYVETKFDKSLDGMKIVLASPTYGPADPACQKDLRVAMMVASRYGLTWVGDASPDRMGWASARNTVAQLLLETEEATGIMWVDSDIRQKPRDMTMLLASAKDFSAEFVSGVYHQRMPLHNPVFYNYNKKIEKFQPCDEYPDNVFAPSEGCGFGFVYTSRKLIEAIAKLPTFDPEKGWFPDERDSGGFGEDLSFCWQAMQAKVQLYVNTGVQVGHSGDPYVVYKEDHVRELALGRADTSAKKKPEKWGLKK
jgi:hypothetical protein